MSFIDADQMNSDLLSTPLIGKTYDDAREEGTDIIMAYGAPNEYESRIRAQGAVVDLMLHEKYGADLPRKIVMPEKEWNILSEDLQEYVRESETDLKTTSGLNTAFDDIKSVLLEANEDDKINWHSSDYYSTKCAATQKMANWTIKNTNNRTFGHKTSLWKRESPYKRNFLAQTGDIIRQSYYAIKDKIL